MTQREREEPSRILKHLYLGRRWAGLGWVPCLISTYCTYTIHAIVICYILHDVFCGEDASSPSLLVADDMLLPVLPVVLMRCGADVAVLLQEERSTQKTEIY